MKTIITNKMPRVENTDAEMIAQGIVAFQQVEFVISFFGSEITTSHDTKIMQDGSQIVIGGCGYIPDGYDITHCRIRPPVEQQPAPDVAALVAALEEARHYVAASPEPVRDGFIQEIDAALAAHRSSKHC